VYIVFTVFTHREIAALNQERRLQDATVLPMHT